LGDITLPNFVIFLKGNIESLVYRITRRNREGEAKEISTEYLRTLQNKYEQYLLKLQSMYSSERLLVIDTDDKNA
jgi:deoxyadenosine/deoxycytidine kinase